MRMHRPFLAGLKCRKVLVLRLASYEALIQGLTIGKQLQFLSERVHE